MALNPDKIQFLLNQAAKSEYRSFGGIIGQIFSYLDKEIKDNPVFDKYEIDRKKWDNWPDDSHHCWTLPSNIDDAQSLAYNIYRSIASNGPENADNIAFTLFRRSSLAENVDKLNSTFLEYFAQALTEIVNANPERDSEKPKAVKGDIVFIIHGHDNELKTEVLLLLKRAGVNSFVLHEQPDRGRTIIDKLVEETYHAGYAIALLTPDDLTDLGTNRARQNVILEIGYFLGKVGKERIRMIVKKDVEIPSDLQGVLYEKHDEKGAWKIKLLKEIQAVGIYVDIQSAIDSF